MALASIRHELKARGIVPRKKWGQHFLVDRNIMNKVVAAAGLDGGDTVLEVGPGLGEMTLLLARGAGRVIAAEIDPRLAEILREKTALLPNVEVIDQDILEIDFNLLRGREGEKIKVVANLPYQISTPLLFRFIEARALFSDLTLMLQKEVAERLVAPPGGKEYGPLSIFTQVFSEAAIRFYVKPASFFPPPAVESAVIQIGMRSRPLVDLRDETWFKRVVRGAMGYRRKTLANALRYSGLAHLPRVIESMKEAGIDPQRRPGTLTIQEFANLAEILKP